MLIVATIVAVLLSALPARAGVEVESFVLDNGMTFLLVPRTEQRNLVAAGWVAHVGSVDERPGMTGISHFFEHMMFKGTTTIGTSDPEADARFMAEQEAVRGELRALQLGQQYARYRKGEIDDPWNPAYDTEPMRVLREKLRASMDAHREVIVKDELWSLYEQNGGTGLNAFTSRDLTFYMVQLPANRIELWAWLESDRLGDPVFREFYSERDVVHEERRMRTDSNPVGVLNEQLMAMFWTSAPYAWSPIGWPSDLESYTMEQALAYFDTYYAPNNLTAILVGDFDAEALKPMLTRYFGGLERRPDPPPVVTLEVTQTGEKRLSGACDCSPRAQIIYQAPPYGHPDGFVLDVLSDVLNGRTGRLFHAMVEGAAVANGAAAFHEPNKHAGALHLIGVGRESTTPEVLEDLLLQEIARLKEEPVPDDELLKVKNAVRADTWRGMRTNQGLMVALGFAAHRGDWKWIDEEPARRLAVTADDIQRVARRWLVPERSTVAHYTRAVADE